jgi:hypothetical protein
VIEITYTYRFDCDWPAGPSSGPAPSLCRDHLIVHGSETQFDAKLRARREGWTISRSKRGATYVRCPTHSFQYRDHKTGRPVRG